MALFGNFVYLTMALPHFFDEASCFARLRAEAANKAHTTTVAAALVSAVFVFQIIAMVRTARRSQRG